MQRLKKWRWWLAGGLALVAFFIVTLIILADKYVEPALKKRLRTLVIDGSDSLYTYTLGDLEVSLFGGSVEIDELRVQVDSSRYYELAARNALPSLTLDVEMHHGHLRGLDVLPLIFGKKIALKELKSENADVRLTRHHQKGSGPLNKESLPFWKLIQPEISRITIDRIRLEGLKLLYKSSDTSRSMKLQFDTCHAELDNVRIDSVSAFDTSRIGFAKAVAFELRDVKFRTADSASKMKAESFLYSSRTRTLEVKEFKVQPTLKDKNEYYRSPERKEGMSVIEIRSGVFTGFRLERYLADNFFVADSLLIDEPQITQYVDKTYPPFMESKVGSYPHQRLLNANSYISINGVAVRKADISYTEKAEKTKQEGTVRLDDVDVTISNITNDPVRIKKHPKCLATMSGKILGSSPFSIRFTFHLDSTEGEYDAEGEIMNVNASALNSISVPLANTTLRSFNMHRLDFKLRLNDIEGRGEVRMKYNDLYVVLHKTDKETGNATVNTFFTRLMNKYVLHPQNPGPDGKERVASAVRKSRQSYQAFFGLLWKTLFTGMQDVMIRSGSYE